VPTIRSKFILLALAAGIPLAAAVAAGTHPAAPSGADPLAAGEQTAAAAPSLAALQTRARERSPRLAELAARLAAAREEIAPAGALADPMVEVRLQNMGLDRWSVGSEPMSMLETGVRQGLPYPGKRAARRAVAAAEAETLAAELAASEREIAREVAALYARLFALDRERLLVEQAGELVDLLLATLTSRYAAGEGDQAALLAVQLERTGLAERQVEVAGERAEAEGLLRGLLDLPPGTPIGPVEELPALAPLPAGIAEAAARLAPEVAVRRAEAEIARRGEELARLDLKPDFSLAAGLGWRGDDDPALMLGFGVELPFWRKSRQEPLARAAGHRAAAAREARRAAELAARAEAERLLGAWWRAGEQLRLLDEALLPQSAAAFDAARSAYLHTRGDFAPVVESANRWLDARVRRTRLAAEQLTVRAALAALLDEPIPPATEGGRP